MKWRHLWSVPVGIAFGYVCALLVAPWFGVLCTVCSFFLRWRFTGVARTGGPRISRFIPVYPASSRIASDQTVILGNTSQIGTSPSGLLSLSGREHETRFADRAFLNFVSWCFGG